MTVKEAKNSREDDGLLRAQPGNVVALLRRIIRASDIHSKRLLKETGLTTAQLIVLQSIRDLGEVTSRVLSLDANLSQSTITMILDRLEQKGLIERYRSTIDRRVVHARLTPAGIDILTTAPALLHETVRTGFARKSARDQARIVRALRDVVTLLESASEIESITLEDHTSTSSISQ